MRTDITKLIVALRFSANASQKLYHANQESAISGFLYTYSLRNPQGQYFIWQLAIQTASRDGSQLQRSPLFHSAVNQCPCVLVQYQGKNHPRTGHEGPEGEYRYSSIRSLTSTLEGVGGQRHVPAASTPVKTRYPLVKYNAVNIRLLLTICGPGCSVGIATGYGLEGPEIESRWRREFPQCTDRPWGTQPPVQWVPGPSRG